MSPQSRACAACKVEACASDACETRNRGSAPAAGACRHLSKSKLLQRSTTARQPRCGSNDSANGIING
eukprot:14785990-Alexandrium_andersonii.AAC.1